MRTLIAALSLSAVLSLSARAEDIPSKQSFAAGVAAAEARRWQEACQYFEASLAQADRPATRFNLILVNDELHQPLDVVRHAVAFLAFPDQAEHAPARARARELLARATEQLAVLTTDALPSSLALSIDGTAPSVREQQRIYLTPGAHRLEARRDGELIDSVEVQLGVGQVAPWPNPRHASSLRADPANSTQQTTPPLPSAALPRSAARLVDRSEQTRTRVAWTLGGMGTAIQLSALGVYLGAVQRADEFGQRDLSKLGVEEARNDAVRLQNTIPALAMTGGALLAAAAALGARSTRRGSVGWSVGALLTATAMAGGGLALVLREAPFVPGSELPEPTRQGGCLLATSALPVFAYGVGALVARRRGRTTHAAFPLGARW